MQNIFNQFRTDIAFVRCNFKTVSTVPTDQTVPAHRKKCYSILVPRVTQLKRSYLENISSGYVRNIRNYGLPHFDWLLFQFMLYILGFISRLILKSL